MRILSRYVGATVFKSILLVLVIIVGLDGIAAFIDAEHALDVNYAHALGVNLTELLVSQPR